MRIHVLCLAQLPRTGSVVPRHDQVHAVRGVRVQSTSVPPGTSGAFPLQLLPDQSGPPRGGVRPRQVGLVPSRPLAVGPGRLLIRMSFAFQVRQHRDQIGQVRELSVRELLL